MGEREKRYRRDHTCNTRFFTSKTRQTDETEHEPMQPPTGYKQAAICASLVLYIPGVCIVPSTSYAYMHRNQKCAFVFGLKEVNK
jgi:hypothetical protein